MKTLFALAALLGILLVAAPSARACPPAAFGVAGGGYGMGVGLPVAMGYGGGFGVGAGAYPMAPAFGTPFVAAGAYGAPVMGVPVGGGFTQINNFRRPRLLRRVFRAF
jgi:hypothetical protein